MRCVAYESVGRNGVMSNDNATCVAPFHRWQVEKETTTTEHISIANIANQLSLLTSHVFPADGSFRHNAQLHARMYSYMLTKFSSKLHDHSSNVENCSLSNVTHAFVSFVRTLAALRHSPEFIVYSHTHSHSERLLSSNAGEVRIQSTINKLIYTLQSPNDFILGQKFQKQAAMQLLDRQHCQTKPNSLSLHWIWSDYLIVLSSSTG